MCIQQTVIHGLDRYHWDGDEIIPISIVPSSRPVPGVREKKNYPIDIREFLITERNELIKKTLREDICNYVKNTMKQDWNIFQSRGPGSFDFRATSIASYVTEHIRYSTKGVGKPWLFPDETLFVKEGDCEDRAFLMASLMLASGISGYNIRVVLGKVKLFVDSSVKLTHDHMWVMYKNESGQWMLFEPLYVNKGIDAAKAKKGRILSRESTRVSYIPNYAFNDTHLWKIRHEENTKTFEQYLSTEWNRLNPTFIGEVHKTILNTALTTVAPSWVIDGLNRYFSRIAWVSPIVDDVDNLLIHAYDPRDHFDNGYIEEGWDSVKSRLKRFHDNNHDLQNFSNAAHAISDFYSHTSYVHFAKLLKAADSDGSAVLYDPDQPNAGFQTSPEYSSGSTFDLSGDQYTLNEYYWKTGKNSIPKIWQNKIISGRYGQKNDSHGFFERFANIPDELLKASDFYKRSSLPHHNEIAVDEEKYNSDNKVYRATKVNNIDPLSYENQFRWRKNSAINHIRKAFQDNWAG